MLSKPFGPQLFKSDDSSSLRGDVEGHCSRLFFCPDYFIYTVGCSGWGMDLDTYVSGKYTRELVTIGATVCTKLH